MFRFVACCFVSFMVLAKFAYAEESKTSGAASLENGSYVLRILVPKMAEGKRDITLPAVVGVAKGKLQIKSQGLMGNKFILNGILQDGSIKVGMTDIERQDIISFHFIGNVASQTSADGKLYCFVNDKPGFDGRWVLTKKTKEDQETGKEE